VIKVRSVQDEIFEVFIKKLKEKSDFPDSVAEKLEVLWREEGIASREKILEAIKEGCQDDGENQGN
jgi:hypothetical protein